MGGVSDIFEKDFVETRLSVSTKSNISNINVAFIFPEQSLIFSPYPLVHCRLYWSIGCRVSVFSVLYLRIYCWHWRCCLCWLRKYIPKTTCCHSIFRQAEPLSRLHRWQRYRYIRYIFCFRRIEYLPQSQLLFPCRLQVRILR